MILLCGQRSYICCWHCVFWVEITLFVNHWLLDYAWILCRVKSSLIPSTCHRLIIYCALGYILIIPFCHLVYGGRRIFLPWLWAILETSLSNALNSIMQVVCLGFCVDYNFFLLVILLMSCEVDFIALHLHSFHCWGQVLPSHKMAVDTLALIIISSLWFI